jgi:hypothetical protein
VGVWGVPHAHWLGAYSQSAFAGAGAPRPGWCAVCPPIPFAGAGAPHPGWCAVCPPIPFAGAGAPHPWVRGGTPDLVRALPPRTPAGVRCAPRSRSRALPPRTPAERGARAPLSTPRAGGAAPSTPDGRPYRAAQHVVMPDWPPVSGGFGAEHSVLDAICCMPHSAFCILHSAFCIPLPGSWRAASTASPRPRPGHAGRAKRHSSAAHWGPGAAPLARGSVEGRRAAPLDGGVRGASARERDRGAHRTPAGARGASARKAGLGGTPRSRRGAGRQRPQNGAWGYARVTRVTARSAPATARPRPGHSPRRGPA